jgi:hypothetical protein
VIKSFQAWQARYEAKVDALVAGPFSEQAVAAKLTAWKQQLAGAGYPVAEAAAAELEGILGRARTNRGFSY